MAFRYEAIDASGRTVIDTVNATSAHEAADVLRDRGLFVTELNPLNEAEAAKDTSSSSSNKTGGKLSDVLLMTQQLSMLLRSGARVVDALEAIEEQTNKPAWRNVIQTIRTEVEEGRSFSVALSAFPKLFSAIYINMIAAGEASGDMSLAFDRLGVLTRQQQDIRHRVIGAMAYPCVLVLLCFGVLTALVAFVLPRFAEMFETLDVELPATTKVMISSSNAIKAHWPYVLAGLVAAVTGIVFFLRSPKGREAISRMSVRVPLFGKLVRSIILARICRTWGQLIESRVSLLEAIQLVQRSTRSLDFQELLAEMEKAITAGNSIGPPLKSSWLLPKTLAAAMITGEESGKLADSLLFVAGCLEEENDQVLSSLTRVIEPILLTVMGVIVGVVAISLFLPMFDMATLTGGG